MRHCWLRLRRHKPDGSEYSRPGFRYVYSRCTSCGRRFAIADNGRGPG